jgi:hypothetical protein
MALALSWAESGEIKSISKNKPRENEERIFVFHPLPPPMTFDFFYFLTALVHNP